MQHHFIGDGTKIIVLMGISVHATHEESLKIMDSYVKRKFKDAKELGERKQNIEDRRIIFRKYRGILPMDTLDVRRDWKDYPGMVGNKPGVSDTKITRNIKYITAGIVSFKSQTLGFLSYCNPGDEDTWEPKLLETVRSIRDLK